jgi:hypothetical protein
MEKGTLFVRSLGTVNPFHIALGNSALGVVVQIITLVTVDKIGRR